MARWKRISNLILRLIITKVNGGQIESINGSDAREIISNLILLLRIIINNKEIVGVLVIRDWLSQGRPLNERDLPATRRTKGNMRAVRN